MSTVNRIPLNEVKAASHILWTDSLLADRIALEAVEIINKAHSRKFSFFSGKTVRGVVGGLFYLLSYKHDAIKKQKEIANQLSTTEVTVRDSYRQWLKSFPDLFVEVIQKFSEDEKLRFFVLIDLKKQGITTIS